MGGVLFRARAELRGRWRSWIVMGVLLGLASGAALAAAAGARRTESAYPRFLRAQNAMDALVDVRSMPDFRTVGVERVKALASVADVAPVIGVFQSDIMTASGRRIAFPDAFIIASDDGRFATEVNALKILLGRHADSSRIDEVVVGFSIAERFEIELGDMLTVRLLKFDETFTPTGGVDRSVPVRVVGIGAIPGEFEPLAGAAIPMIHLTSAFLHSASDFITPDGTAYAVRFAPGHDPVTLEEEARAAGLGAQVFFKQSIQTESVRRSGRIQAIALWLLAGLTALAAIAILGQALARHSTLESLDHPALRALGMSRAQLLGIGIVRALAVAGSAVIVAAAVAILSSPLTPLGLARVAEPSPGIAVDLTVIGAGAGAVLLLVSVAAMLALRTALRPSSQALKLSRAAGTLARLGGRPSAVVGVQLALERGRGSTAVPVRSTVTGVALGIVAIASALTFAASLHHLTETPALSGWTFDLAVGGPGDQMKSLRQQLEDEGLLALWEPGTIATLAIGGEEIADAALVFPPEGQIGPAISEGRAPQTAEEVVLGRDTMADLGLAIGDEVELAHVDDQGSRDISTLNGERFRVVGRIVQPSLGFNLVGAGHGAAITTDGLARLDAQEDDLETAFVRLTDPGSIRAVVERIAQSTPGVFMSARRGSDDAASVRRIESMPMLLAGILGAMALLSVVHTLLTSIRRRGRDLAILRTLGFVRGQVRSAVAWQATTLVSISLVLGIPLGIAIGRWGWLLFADSLGVVPTAVAPAIGLALITPGVLVLANVVSLFPARAAGRAVPAVVLRTE